MTTGANALDASTPLFAVSEQWELLNEIDTQICFLKSGLHLPTNRDRNADGSPHPDDVEGFVMEGLHAALARLEALHAKSWEIAKKERALVREQVQP